MEWREVKEYEGYYQVSDTGLIRSVDRHIVFSDGRERDYKGINLHIKNDKSGYPIVKLNRHGKNTRYFVHRLVAIAFLPNPLNLPQINHKDENHANNKVDNLEWCDGKYNVRYSLAVKVKQYDKNGNYLRTWDCMQDIQQELGIATPNIIQCCKRKAKTAGGFCWNYESDGCFSNELILSDEEKEKRNHSNRKTYYKDHKATLAYKREWYKRNREKCKEYAKRYMERKKLSMNYEQEHIEKLEEELETL